MSINIILFGETGVGKSSVVNLIAGRPVAEVSPDVEGCTLQSKEYKFDVGKVRVSIWDTVGLEEPEMGVNGYIPAIEKAWLLIKRLREAGGVDLLLFCIRGNRVTMTTQSNYRLFYEILCGQQVPIALVITHLEREVDYGGLVDSKLQEYREVWYQVRRTCLRDRNTRQQRARGEIWEIAEGNPRVAATAR
ncbi:P-loop containing nucleoside triphosphate hydrolase protein [Pisolithus marmoratus]|nr:P-loop containing nucleoside triphosphate hydrolase protein [Pisolithus marmoratus]